MKKILVRLFLSQIKWCLGKGILTLVSDLKLSSLPSGQQETLLLDSAVINISVSVTLLVTEPGRQSFTHPWTGRASV